MKTISKFFFFGIMMLFASSIIAQQAIVTQTGTSKPDKLEMLKALHGPTVYVEEQAEGSSRTIGDNCANPIPIGSLPYNDTNTTDGRGNNYINTCLNDFDGGNDIIYKLTLAAQTTIVVTLDPKGTLHTGIALSDACPLDGTCLAVSAAISGSGTPHGFTVALEAGDYYIMIDTWPEPLYIPSFELSITADVLPPANDNCADAIAVSEVIDLPFNTTNATNDVYGVDGANIWYNYTAGFNGTAVISLCGSFYDTQVAVWDGSACPPTTQLAFSDDYCDFQSEVTIPVVAGNQYKIEIGGWDGESGNGLLSIFEQETCILICPGIGSIQEGEPCGQDINGGCNMINPQYKNVSNGNVLCGNLWSYDGERDTDWFKVVLTKPSNLTMTLSSEALTTFGLVGQVELGVDSCDNITGSLSVYQNTYPCQEDSITVLYLPKGTYFLFVGLADYYNHPCPGGGVDYIAKFKFEQIPSGNLAGTIKDAATLLPIANVKVTAGDYFDYTNLSGVYNFSVPVGTYTVDADGFPVGYSSDSYPGAIVTLNTTTYVNFNLDKLPAPILHQPVAGVEKVTLTWSPASSKNGRQLIGDIASSSKYIPSSSVTLDFTMTIWSPDFEKGTYCKLTFPAGFTPASATPLNGVSPVIYSDSVVYKGEFYDDGSPEEITFSVTMNTGVGITGPKSIAYLVKGNGTYGPEHFFDGTIVIYQNGGIYHPVYNVYRQKGREFIYITSIIDSTTYVDIVIPGGDLWCYYVTQVFEDLSESAPSNILCATPTTQPNSTCADAFFYGPVNSQEMTGTLLHSSDMRWYEFTVPYTMDVAISLCNSSFDTQLALYEDCSDFAGTLPIGALTSNTDNVNWCSVTTRSQIEYKFLPGGTYYAVVYGQNGEFGNYEINIRQIQILEIREGWSGISTYMNADSANFANVLVNSSSDLVIVIGQNPNGVYWPAVNINTIGNMTPEKGYKAKMNNTLSDYDRTDLIYGTEVGNKTVSIPKGVSYLPVKVPYKTLTTSLVAELMIDTSLMLMFDIYNNDIIWPGGGINPGHPASFDTLVPGHAYLINMYKAHNYTYPAPMMGPGNDSPEQPLRGNKTSWNDVVNTGNTHFISISENAQKEFHSGDVVGVFNSEGVCVGTSEYLGEGNLFLAANGDDEYTNEIDGFSVGEEMNYKLFRSNNSIYDLKPTYSSQMPNSDGSYVTEGMSLITEFKLSATSISENELSSLNLYPNPSTGIFNISGLSNNVKMTVCNAQGQELYSKVVSGNTQLDLTSQSKGIYFVRFMSENSTRIKKVVLK